MGNELRTNRNATSTILVILLVVCNTLVTGQAVQPSDPATVLDAMAEDYYMPSVRAAFGTFTFEYSDLPTPFARWLEENLAVAAGSSRRVQLLNRNAAAAMDPVFRKEYEAFFRETGTSALLHGRYFLEGQQVRVRLELTDLGSATLIGARDWYIPASKVPAYASVCPAEAATARAGELARLGAATQGGLAVSVSTDRGTGAAYRDGEELAALVTVNKDAYVRLYHVDGTGHIQMIWPNRFSGGNGLIKAGSSIKLPGSHDPFAFKMQPPYGTEFLKAIASTLPFSDSQADFSDLGTNYHTAATRGLAVTEATMSTGASAGAGVQGSSPLEIAEALASYYIGP
ncbi:MAG: DUF4384 domain-containing protein [Spirochaetota bacterium]